MPTPNDLRNRHLQDKLTSLGARRMSDVKGPHGSKMEFFTLNGQCIIVQWYNPSFGGYEVYSPVFNGNEVKGTFEALDAIAAERYATR